MTLRDRIDRGFAQWGRGIVRHRWLTLAIVLTGAGILSLRVPGIRSDNSLEAHLHPGDPALALYEQFRDQFGGDSLVLIAIESTRIFTLPFLERLRDLHQDLEREVPHLDDVTSLLNARSTYGDRDRLVVEDLLEHWPHDAAGLASLRARVLANPVYRGTLISGDGRVTTVTLEPSTYSSLGEEQSPLAGFEAAGNPRKEHARYITETELGALVDAVREVAARHDAPDFRIHLAGGPVLAHRLNQQMQSDMAVFMWSALALILTVLYLLFRRFSGVLLPLVVVMLALGSTLGVMVLLDIPLSLVTEILPPFLITVGVCTSVHILVIFFRELGRGMPRDQAIVLSLGHCGLAVLMTSLTTAGGLLSFSMAEMAPVSQLGLVAPLGVMLAMLFSVTLLPALLAVVPLSGKPASGTERNRPLHRLLQGCGSLAIRAPWTVVAVWLGVVVLASAGASRLRLSQDELGWFPEQDPLRRSMALIDRELGGAMSVEVVVDTGRENGLHSPALLRKLEGAERAVASIREGDLHVGRTTSLLEVLKETHQALHENRPRFYAIPEQRELIAQELLLFENSGSDDLEKLVDPRFSMARVSLEVPWVDAMLYPRFLDRIQREFSRRLGSSARVRVTGASALLARLAAGLVITLGRSYGIALGIITPLMIFLLGSFRRGCLSMAPNLIPVLAVLGVMGWLRIPMDITSMLVGGIIIGLAVDDTIHFMHGFNRVYRETGDPARAVQDTLRATGTAMLFTSVVLAAGFFIFVLAYLNNVSTFGALSGLATIIAFLADVTLAPALMILVTRGRATPRSAANPPAERPPAASIAASMQV